MKKTMLMVILVMGCSATAFAQGGDSPREVADRIRGDAVRAENRGDFERAREAYGAANRAEGKDRDGARDESAAITVGDRVDREPRNERF